MIGTVRYSLKMQQKEVQHDDMGQHEDEEQQDGYSMMRYNSAVMQHGAAL